MPGFDKTGPMGQGAQTGRRMGKCVADNDTNVEELPRGRGLRRGLGRGMRLRNGLGSPGGGRGRGRR